MGFSRQRSPLVLAALLLGLSALVAACGGGKKAEEPRSSGTTATSPAATAPAPVASAPATGGGPAEEASVALVATDEGGRFRFEPNAIEVRPGQRVSLRVSNTGLSAHDFVISSLKVESGQLNPGEEKVVTFTAPGQPGEYEFMCSVPGHAQLGMTGKLIVKQ